MISLANHGRDPFRVVPGDPSSTVIIHVPHASRHIPIWVRAGLLIDGSTLERELDAMTDAHTDVIAERAADLVDGPRPWLFINQLSRLVVDPERFPDDREEMNAAGMGAVYTRTSDGSPLRNLPADDISGLVDRYYTPYAGAFERLVDGRIDAVGEVSIIDLHSYPRAALPYELHADSARPEVCIGTDEFHTGSELAEAAEQAFSPFKTDANTPFAGCYVPLKHFGTTPQVQGLMIELRRDIYLDGSFDADKAAVERIARSLAYLADNLSTDAAVGK